MKKKNCWMRINSIELLRKKYSLRSPIESRSRVCERKRQFLWYMCPTYYKYKFTPWVSPLRVEIFLSGWHLLKTNFFFLFRKNRVLYFSSSLGLAFFLIYVKPKKKNQGHWVKSIIDSFLRGRERERSVYVQQLVIVITNWFSFEAC